MSRRWFLGTPPHGPEPRPVADAPPPAASRHVGAYRACLLAGCPMLEGCSLNGAPSYSLFGAFFPAWLLCAALGLVAALAFRGLVIAVGLEEVMPLRLLVYTAFGAGLAAWLWLGLFGGGS